MGAGWRPNRADTCHTEPPTSPTPNPSGPSLRRSPGTRSGLSPGCRCPVATCGRVPYGMKTFYASGKPYTHSDAHEEHFTPPYRQTCRWRNRRPCKTLRAACCSACDGNAPNLTQTTGAPLSRRWLTVSSWAHRALEPDSSECCER